MATVTIASGAAVSSSFRPSVEPASRRTLDLYYMIDGLTAADMRLEFSDDGTNFYEMKNASGDVFKQTSFSASNWFVFENVPSFRWIRFKTTANGGSANVNQAAERTVTVLVVD